MQKLDYLFLHAISPLITDLSLYDVVNTPGVAADLSHICTLSQVKGYLPEDDGIKKALDGSDFVVISAGFPRKVYLFSINSKIIIELGESIAKFSPNAFILVITNPINSTVPIIAEVLKEYNVFNPKKLFGITTLDSVRLATFVAEHFKTVAEPNCYEIPVIGGHSGTTIIPLISQSKPKVELNQDELKSLVYRVQYAGDEVIEAKNGNGSATLSMAIGHSGIIQSSFIYLPGIPGGDEIIKRVNLQFFAVQVELGVDGAQRVKHFGAISQYEEQILDDAIIELEETIYYFNI
ncbi:malate dehydrogenase, NAD-dependent [Pneumocystis murina B123]|uniref:malate dehydrogenase n=1 Tax=Pneumocystis murina (strain B123) TaxID=1069680 RepID=M7NLG2_PNEMU|nr:malate dehydrogenase, NAD-dependent [Pneumocystis murina B123]EMR08037.1 malate dehydrogenase, NAD-dependent [Pneumocystis murina B123]